MYPTADGARRGASCPSRGHRILLLLALLALEFLTSACTGTRDTPLVLLRVTSTPPGAKVAINGETPTLTCPVRQYPMRPSGDTLITLTLEGYQESTQRLTLAQLSSNPVLEITLKPLAAPPDGTPVPAPGPTPIPPLELEVCVKPFGPQVTMKVGEEETPLAAECQTAKLEAGRETLQVQASAPGRLTSSRTLTRADFTAAAPVWLELRPQGGGGGGPARTPGPAVDTLVDFKVDSQPAEATVLLGDGSQCVTPCQLQLRNPPRVLLVRITKPGYQEWSQRFALTGKGTEKISAILKPMVAKPIVVHVQSEPSGAEVRMGGQKVGLTPFDLTLKDLSKPVELLFAKEGLESVPRTLEPAQLTEGAIITASLRKTGGLPSSKECRGADRDRWMEQIDRAMRKQSKAPSFKELDELRKCMTDAKDYEGLEQVLTLMMTDPVRGRDARLYYERGKARLAQPNAGKGEFRGCAEDMMAAIERSGTDQCQQWRAQMMLYSCSIKYRNRLGRFEGSEAFAGIKEPEAVFRDWTNDMGNTEEQELTSDERKCFFEVDKKRKEFEAERKEGVKR